jgi:hypothetical protein
MNVRSAPRPLAGGAALLAVALAAVLRPAPAAGQGVAGGCHCFRERTYDPARPAAADPYILATSRSSLLSAAFAVPKAELVQGAMSGTPPEDMWIARWAGARAGRDAGALLEARGAKGSWKAALAGAPGLGGPFGAALARGAADAELAALAVDDVLAARFRADPAAVQALRAAGATSEEVVVATILAARLGTPTVPLLKAVQAGKTTWGALLADAALPPKEIDAFVRARVR